VDVNVRKLREQDLAWADLVFISGMIAQRDSAHKLIARCRAAGKTIVAGGPLFTIEHEQFPAVDHFVLNEAEATLPGFLQDFERGCAKRVYTSAEFPDIRQTPAPLWELADLGRYASMSVQFSRGCPFQCEFCDIIVLYGRRPRTKRPRQVLAEVCGARTGSRSDAGGRTGNRRFGGSRTGDGDCPGSTGNGCSHRPQPGAFPAGARANRGDCFPGDANQCPAADPGAPGRKGPARVPPKRDLLYGQAAVCDRLAPPALWPGCCR